MITMVGAAIVLCAAFAATYLQTGDIWDSMLAAAVVILLYLFILCVKTARSLRSARGRVVLCVLGVLFTVSVSAHWILLRSMTNWQFANMQTIRKVIDHGVLHSAMYQRAMPAFAAYYRQGGNRPRVLGNVFDEQNHRIDASSGLLDTLYEGLRVYAVRSGDSEIVLIGEGSFTNGLDSSFANYDGRRGIVQSRVILSERGVSYEIQN